MKPNILPYVVIIALFIGHLIVGGQGRLEDGGRSNRGDSTANNASTNATTTAMDDDESKLALKVCVQRECFTHGRGIAWNSICYCCLVLPDVPCWRVLKNCQNNCPSCTPKCPSNPSSTGELRLRA